MKPKEIRSIRLAEDLGQIFKKVGVKHLFTMPSQTIDPIVEELTSSLGLEVLINSSEASSIDSAWACAHLSGVATAVVVDYTFIPSGVAQLLKRATRNNDPLILVLLGEVDEETVGAFIKTGAIVSHISDSDYLISQEGTGPWVLLSDDVVCSDVKKEKAPLLDNASSSKEKCAHFALMSGTRETRVSSLERLVVQIRSLHHNAIYIPDAGAAHRILFSISQKMNIEILDHDALIPMGWSLRVSLGASLAIPGRVVVPILGDGSAMIQGMELGYLRKYRIPALVVLAVNGTLGRRDESSILGQKSLVPTIDWSVFCESLEIPCLKRQTFFDDEEIKDFTAIAFKSRTPIVIPVDTSRDTSLDYEVVTNLTKNQSYLL